VEFVPEAGLIVKGVVPGDRGNYSVEVVMLSHVGSDRQTIMVEVAGKNTVIFDL
jgi:hypothetical protein